MNCAHCGVELAAAGTCENAECVLNVPLDPAVVLQMVTLDRNTEREKRIAADAEVARLRGLGVDNEVLRNEVGTLRASLSLHLTRNTELHHQGNQLANEVARLALAANEWAAREQATRDKLERFIVKNHRLRDQIRELAAWKADAERLASVVREARRRKMLAYQSTNADTLDGKAEGALARHEARLKADKEQAE